VSKIPHGPEGPQIENEVSISRTNVDGMDADRLVEFLTEEDRAFGCHFHDEDIRLDIELPSGSLRSLPERMLSDAMKLSGNIPEQLQAELVAKYIRTHGNPNGWADDKSYVEAIITSVRDYNDPSKKHFEVERTTLIKRPPSPPLNIEEFREWMQPPKTVVLDPSNPLNTAQQFTDIEFSSGLKIILIRYQGDFYSWDGTKYVEIEIELLKAELYKFLERGVYYKKKELKSFKPTQVLVNQIMDALKAVVQLAADQKAPAWLDQTNYPHANEIVPVENGLLHLPTRELLPHSSSFLSHTALDYNYDPEAPEPDQFVKFLDSLFGSDIDAKNLLQEIFGYIVSGETSFQKIPAIVGPKRAGKGVLGRVLVALLGAKNVCSPTLSSFATNFPLQPLIGKTLALMSDARLDGSINQKAIVENLLRVSGEDDVNIARKNKTDWVGRLLVRFMILTNEIPRLADPSGALSGRFVILVLTRSFYGNEDPRLTEKLLAELPGILNWALDGWDRLMKQGQFTLPASSVDAMTELEYLSSPIQKFLDEQCLFVESAEMPFDELFSMWEKWCRTENRKYTGTKATFGRDLNAAHPELRKVRKNIGGSRPYYYCGITPRFVSQKCSMDGSQTFAMVLNPIIQDKS
jgi:putative DNA primase/helicase